MHCVLGLRRPLSPLFFRTYIYTSGSPRAGWLSPVCTIIETKIYLYSKREREVVVLEMKIQRRKNFLIEYEFFFFLNWWCVRSSSSKRGEFTFWTSCWGSFFPTFPSLSCFWFIIILCTHSFLFFISLFGHFFQKSWENNFLSLLFASWI